MMKKLLESMSKIANTVIEDESMVAEDDLGTNPKRPSREGARPARGHEAKPQYSTVKEDDAGIDNLLSSLRKGWNKIESGNEYSEQGKNAIHQIYNSLRGALMAGDVDAFNRKWEHYSSTAPDAFDCLIDCAELDANSINTELAEDEPVDALSNRMEFNYQLLGRLQADCEYFLHEGGGSERHLWAGSVADQIAKMKELYNSFPADEKPQYITPADIIHYENEMSASLMSEATHPSLNRSPEERKANRELWDRINSKGVVPSIDRERYTDINGLEGPFRFKSGRVVYYDPQEGKYYDRDRDMYLDNSESLGETITQGLQFESTDTTNKTKVYAYVTELRKSMAAAGVIYESSNDFKRVCSKVFDNLELLESTSTIAQAGTAFIQRLDSMDQFRDLEIKLGAKIAYIDAALSENTVQLWGSTTPHIITKIHMASPGKIKQLEFNNDPLQVYPRADKLTYNGLNIDHTAFFGDKQSAEQALTMLLTAAPAELIIKNYININLGEGATDIFASAGKKAAKKAHDELKAKLNMTKPERKDPRTVDKDGKKIYEDHESIVFRNGEDVATIKPHRAGWVATYILDGVEELEYFDSLIRAQEYLEDYGFDLDTLAEGWESGPDEYERPERDADHDYDTHRQEKADDKYERNNTFTTKYTVYDGVQHKAVAGPFASQSEAIAARSKIRLNSQHLSIQTSKTRNKQVGEDMNQSNIPAPTNERPITKELSELAVNPNKANPGQTADVKFNGWNIRYQLKPKQGSGEFKGMAVHSQSAKTPPVSATGASAEDVLAQLKAKIAANKGSAEISASKVMVDFNVLVTRDIVGHNDMIYGDIVNHNGAPTLLISAENPGGMQKATDRRSLANKTEGTTGQHAFGLSGKRAHAAGLTHARYTLGAPETYIPGVTAYPLEFNSEVHPGEVVRLSSPGVTIAYPTKSAGVATESTIVEYADMNEIPKLRDRNDFRERMKTLSDIQLDPDTAKDPQLKAEVLRKRAELMKQARDQGLSESWVVVDSKNKAVKMFESKTLAYNYVIENMFESTLVVKHRDEIEESRSTEKFGRALDKADKDQSGDRTGMPSMEERRARYLKQQAEKEAGKKVVKEYGATSTGSPTSKPGASAVPTPVAPTPVATATSNKPVAPVVNTTAPTTPGISTDAANLASAAARDPKIAAQVKAMAAQAKAGI